MTLRNRESSNFQGFPQCWSSSRRGRIPATTPVNAYLKDVLAMRPIYHQIEPRVKAHIFVAALALLVQRLLGRRLKEAGVDLSPARAMEALSTVRLVIFRLEGQPERRGVTGGCPDARLVLKALKLVDQRPPVPPEGEDTVI